MKITYPSDLPSDPREAYRRGWNDRASAGASRAASVKSEARSVAARANGAKGGRPRKQPIAE